MNAKAARFCFYGNLKLVEGSGADLEKRNLYFGLAKLAEAVSDVDRRVQLLRQEVAHLRARLEDAPDLADGRPGGAAVTQANRAEPGAPGRGLQEGR